MPDVRAANGYLRSHRFAGRTGFADNPRLFRPGTWLETGVDGKKVAQFAQAVWSTPIRLATQQQDQGK